MATHIDKLALIPRKYVERLERIEAGLATLPKREYLTKDEYRAQKTALTRAKNSGEPERVLRAVKLAVELWNHKVWPDDWNRWRIALEDAADDARRASWDADEWQRQEYLEGLARELDAASLVLFR